MSLIQTARQPNLNSLTFLHLLLTQLAAAAAVLLPASTSRRQTITNPVDFMPLEAYVIMKR